MSGNARSLHRASATCSGRRRCVFRNVLAVAAFALELLGGVPTAGAIQAGESDAGRHGFAVGIFHGDALCTGTLIAPNLVLTARHCVSEGSAGEVDCSTRFPEQTVDPGNVTISTEVALAHAKRTTVASIVVPDDRASCGNDIALLVLSRNILAAEAKPAAPALFPMTDASRVGREILAIGYGNTSPVTRDSGVRRMRRGIEILCVPGDPRFECAHVRPLETDREFITEGFTCAGDSGGGAFEPTSVDEGAPLVLGVFSRGPTIASDCFNAIYTRTDKHAELLRRVGRDAAARGFYTTPTWVTAIEPEPAPAPPEVAREQEGGCRVRASAAPGDHGALVALLVVSGVRRWRRGRRPSPGPRR